MANFNWVDYVFLAIFFISIIAGLMRGVVKEVLGVLVWLLAFGAGILFSSRLATFFMSSQQVESTVSSVSQNSSAQPVSMVAVGISFFLIFIVALILGKILIYFLSAGLNIGGIGLVNRFLGGIFGIGRGSLMILFLMFLVEMTNFSKESWWQDSQLVNYLYPTVQWLGEMMNPSFENLKTQMKQKMVSENLREENF